MNVFYSIHICVVLFKRVCYLKTKQKRTTFNPRRFHPITPRAESPHVGDIPCTARIGHVTRVQDAVHHLVGHRGKTGEDPHGFWRKATNKSRKGKCLILHRTMVLGGKSRVWIWRTFTNLLSHHMSYFYIILGTLHLKHQASCSTNKTSSNLRGFTCKKNLAHNLH